MGKTIIRKQEDFGLWVYNELKNRKISQVDFAKVVGVTEAAICNYNQSKRFPRLNVLIRILNKIGKHIEFVDD